jgi:hypothetical protein
MRILSTSVRHIWTTDVQLVVATLGLFTDEVPDEIRA